MPDVERIDYGGTIPRTRAEMVEHAHKVIGADWYSSAAERDMARMVLWALGAGEQAETFTPGD